MEFVMFIIMLHKDNNKSLLIKSDEQIKKRRNIIYVLGKNVFHFILPIKIH